ncbi:MAG TPA: hypothetical protein VJP83_05455 [Terriglobales bacterium]|nr:hypothetical protein [Terriglobales bacterium]
MSLFRGRDRISEVIAQVTDELARRGLRPPMFVSPNAPGIPADNTQQVYAAHERSLER